MEKNPEVYYQQVARYYDDDARDFEQRYQENPVLQRIREDFRRETETGRFSNILEIGCGPGFDVCYYAEKYPDARVHALDVSPEMIDLTRKNAESMGLQNVSYGVGSTEDIATCFGDKQFDLVYVYFGGLNTVFDLAKAARDIEQVCADNAVLVLTFVNRYYLTEIPLWLATGRFDKAFERIRNRWRGYSDHRKIPTRPYSSKDIYTSFGKVFQITRKRGYSILYPAWYRSHLLPRLGGLAEVLWKADRFLAHTPFWNTGEYSLYVMKKQRG